MLRLGRYRGFVLLDYDGAEPPESAVPRAARYMRGMLHLLDRQRVLEAPSNGHAAEVLSDLPPVVTATAGPG
jgi:hypothetical protein